MSTPTKEKRQTPDIVPTVVDLAEALGTTRKTLNVWRKLDGAPRPRPNGGHSVTEWRNFISSRGLGSQTLGSREEQLMDSEALRARKLLAEVEDRELKVLVRKGQFVPIDAVRERWFYHIGQANALLRNKLENELPPLLVGRDAVDIRKENARVVDEYIAIMNSGEQKQIPKLETRGRKKSDDRPAR
jgi:hypothetical protein